MMMGQKLLNWRNGDGEGMGTNATRMGRDGKECWNEVWKGTFLGAGWGWGYNVVPVSLSTSVPLFSLSFKRKRK